MKATKLLHAHKRKGVRKGMLSRKIKCRVFIFVIAALFLWEFSSSSLAKEAGPKLPVKSSLQSESTLKLSIKDSVRIALLNNLDIAVERFNPQIAQTFVAKAKSEFHPVVFTGVDGERTVSPSSTSTFTNVVASSNLNFNAGLKSKVITGGTVEVRYDSNRNRTNSRVATLTPSFTTNLSLTVTQPLLRGYGITINRSNIDISKNQRRISEIEFASRVNDIVAQTEVAYWELVSAEEIFKVRQRSQELAEELLRKNQIQVEVGVMAPVEILQAEAVVAERREAIINARVAIKDAEDKLRRIMNPKEHKDMWALTVVPTDEPPFEEQQFDLEDILKKSFVKRYDYREAKLDLKNRGIRVKVSKNGMLPRLDMVSSVGLNGLSGRTTSLGLSTLGGPSPLDGNYTDSLHELFSGDFYSWMIGVSVEFPIGNVERRSEYTRRKLEERQAIIKLHNLELVIQEEVRKAARRLNGDLERVKATRVAEELARERLESEEKKLEVGISTNFEVLELQEDLAIAENNAVRAIIDYNESMVELQRVTATLLDNRKIRID